MPSLRRPLPKRVERQGKMPVQASVNFDSRQFGFIRELFTRLSRPTNADLNRIERSVRAGFEINFRRESVGGGGPWAALRPRTQRERRQQGYPATNPILRRTGVYERSWTTSNLGGWRYLERTGAGWVLYVSSAHPWAFTHELGNRTRNVPARPVRYLDSGSTTNIGFTIGWWVDDVISAIMG